MTNQYHTILVSFKPEVLLEEMDGEAVLLNITSERYFGLDEIGLRMWRLLEEHSNSDATAKSILAEYDVDEDTAYNDVATFIVKLEQAGLLAVNTENG